MPIPNDTSSESSRRDVSDAELLGTDTINTINNSNSSGDIDNGKSAYGGVVYTVLYVRHLCCIAHKTIYLNNFPTYY